MHTFTLFNNEPDTLAVKKGQVIFNEGDTAQCDCMYAVLEGEVEITKRGALLETVPPGGVFGEMGLLDHTARSATARAKCDGKLARISDSRFMSIVAQNPHFAVGMMRVLSERVRRNHES